jgi:glycosyltransferase involved in cell wall biosynthesis
VLVEASSQGLVSVSTNISGVPELLIDGDNGLLVAPEDPQALARAMETAIRDANFRHRLGRAAEKRVRTEFNFHNSIRQLKSLFETEWQPSK